MVNCIGGGKKMHKTFIDKNGYARFKNTNKLVHSYVMEKYTGYKLKPWEVVHHIDGNKLNNKPEISVWACKRKSDNQEDQYEAIFYLTETEEEIMDFRAFYVNDTELAKFLTILVERKK